MCNSVKFSKVYGLWDSFEANVNSKNITNVEKMSYLLAAHEGPAKEAITGLTTSNRNNEIAVDILHKHFGKPEKVIDAHYEALDALKRANNDGLACKIGFNQIEKHLRVLESLNENMDSSHLRVVIMSKFPDTVLYQVKLLTPDSRSVKEVKLALEKVIAAMDSTPQTCIPSPRMTFRLQEHLPKLFTSMCRSRTKGNRDAE